MNPPAAVLAFMYVDGAASEVADGWKVLMCRRALRDAQYVVPSAKHWRPEAVAKSAGVLERRVPVMVPSRIPNVPVRIESQRCSGLGASSESKGCSSHPERHSMYKRRTRTRVFQLFLTGEVTGAGVTVGELLLAVFKLIHSLRKLPEANRCNIWAKASGFARPDLRVRICPPNAFKATSENDEVFCGLTT